MSIPSLPGTRYAEMMMSSCLAERISANTSVKSAGGGELLVLLTAGVLGEHQRRALPDP